MLRPLERTLLVDFARGRTLHETAAECSYSYAYLRRVRARLARRLGARSFAAALIVALNDGLLVEPNDDDEEEDRSDG